MLRFICIIVVLFSCAINSAQAQILPDYLKKMSKEERAEYEIDVLRGYEYTERDFQQMILYFRGCMRDGTARQYNCECLAAEYIKKKVVYDDILTDYHIFQEISGKCVDEVSVAGNLYTDCTMMGQIDKRWSDDFCECYANYYAGRFKQNDGKMSRQGRMKTRVSAMQECGYGRNRRDSEEQRRKAAAAIAGKAREKMGLE